MLNAKKCHGKVRKRKSYIVNHHHSNLSPMEYITWQSLGYIRGTLSPWYPIDGAIFHKNFPLKSSSSAGYVRTINPFNFSGNPGRQNWNEFFIRAFGIPDFDKIPTRRNFVDMIQFPFVKPPVCEHKEMYLVGKESIPVLIIGVLDSRELIVFDKNTLSKQRPVIQAFLIDTDQYAPPIRNA